MLFADLLSLHLVTFLMFFILVHVTFFSSRCMLELKFAIYYRAASLPSQASYAVLAEESQAFFKHSPHTNSISNSAILRDNYILLLSDLCVCVLFIVLTLVGECRTLWGKREQAACILVTGDDGK